MTGSATHPEFGINFTGRAQLEVRHDLEYPIERRSDLRIRIQKMLIDRAQRPAGMRLVAIGERPPT